MFTSRWRQSCLAFRFSLGVAGQGASRLAQRIYRTQDWRGPGEAHCPGGSTSAIPGDARRWLRCGLVVESLLRSSWNQSLTAECRLRASAPSPVAAKLPSRGWLPLPVRVGAVEAGAARGSSPRQGPKGAAQGVGELLSGWLDHSCHSRLAPITPQAAADRSGLGQESGCRLWLSIANRRSRL